MTYTEIGGCFELFYDHPCPDITEVHGRRDGYGIYPLGPQSLLEYEGGGETMMPSVMVQELWGCF